MNPFGTSSRQTAARTQRADPDGVPRNHGSDTTSPEVALDMPTNAKMEGGTSPTQQYDDATISSLVVDDYQDAAESVHADIDERSPTQWYECEEDDGGRGRQAKRMRQHHLATTPPPTQPDPEVISSDGYGDDGEVLLQDPTTPGAKKARLATQTPPGYSEE